jgi:hypothetical protein
MDYLDAPKQFRERIILFVGYVLIAIAIVTSTLILVYQAYGFGLNKNGSVIQNGLIFFSSQPSPANIYLNSQLSTYQTNSRIILTAGIYNVKLTKAGYRDWTRTITLNPGTVEHFDYPFLFPDKLTSQKLQTYPTQPGLMTQSPNHRFILVEKPGSITDFDLYDLSNPAKPIITTLSLPAGLLTKATTSESWSLVSWADDNQHILLEHLYDNKSEYILVDRANSSQSINLNKNLNANPTQLTLDNNKYNSYYDFQADGNVLQSLSLNGSVTAAPLNNVLAYKSYGNNTILYVTSDGASKGKVLVKLKQGSSTYTIRSLPAGSNYLVDLTTYNDTLYVAVGASVDNRIYVYDDPVGQIANIPNELPAPEWVLHVPDPNYLSFSNNAQFIIAENGVNYAVYDIQNDLGYLYKNVKEPLDSPQPHISWMDGDRITYVSNGKLEVEDYDNNNLQSLVSASSSFLPAFSSNYKYLYTLTSDPTGQYSLNLTPLALPANL